MQIPMTDLEPATPTLFLAEEEDDAALRPDQRHLLEWLRLQFHRQARQLAYHLMQNRTQLCQAQVEMHQRLLDHHRREQTPAGERRRQLQVLEQKHKADRDRFDVSRKAKHEAFVHTLQYRYKTFRERVLWPARRVTHQTTLVEPDASQIQAELPTLVVDLTEENQPHGREQTLQQLQQSLQAQREELVLAQQQEVARLRQQQLDQQERLAQLHQQQVEMLQQQHETTSRLVHQALEATEG